MKNTTAPNPKDKQTPVEQLTYEDALNELEQIVIALEANNQALEEALAFFERGQALAGRCASLLEQAELKVQQLSGNELSDFAPES